MCSSDLLAKFANGAALNGDERIANYFRWAGEDTLRGLYAPEMRQAVGTTNAAGPLLDFLGRLPAGVPPLERMLALEQRFFLTDHNLIYTDKMSMAAGVEVRVPLLDLDLVEFAVNGVFDHAGEVAPQPHHDRLGFGITQPAIEFEGTRLAG